MKKIKFPIIAACGLVLASQVSFAEGGSGAKGTSSNTDMQGTTSGTTSGGMSGDTTSGTTSGRTGGTVTGGKTQQQSAQQKSGQMAMKKGENYQVLNFTGKSSQLTQMQKNELKTLIDAAKQKGEIDQVHVAVWSDKAFPQKGQELPEADRNLAEQRISALETYMSDNLKVDSVETYSMAERTNWFARAFNTNEAELQSLFAQEGAPQNIDPQEFKVVKKEGGPNKAVILIEMKEQGRQPASTSRSMDEGGMINNQQQRAPSSVDDSFGTDSDTSSGTGMGTGSGTGTDSDSSGTGSGSGSDSP